MQVEIALDYDKNGALTFEKMKNLISIGNGMGRKRLHVKHLIHTSNNSLIIDFEEGSPKIITMEDERNDNS